MDSFCEQLVKKRQTASDVVKVVLIIFVTAIVVLLSVYGFAWFFPLIFIAAGAIALCVYLCRNVSLEYEYIVTNNQLDIDKIMGKSKRKRMVTIDLSRAQDFVVNPPESFEGKAKTTVHASSRKDNDVAVLIAEHNDYGSVMLIFSPNEKTKDAIVQNVPGMLRTRLKSNVK